MTPPSGQQDHDPMHTLVRDVGSIEGQVSLLVELHKQTSADIKEITKGQAVIAASVSSLTGEGKGSRNLITSASGIVSMIISIATAAFVTTKGH